MENSLELVKKRESISALFHEAILLIDRIENDGNSSLDEMSSKYSDILVSLNIEFYNLYNIYHNKDINYQQNYLNIFLLIIFLINTILGRNSQGQEDMSDEEVKKSIMAIRRDCVNLVAVETQIALEGLITAYHQFLLLFGLSDFYVYSLNRLTESGLSERGVKTIGRLIES